MLKKNCTIKNVIFVIMYYTCCTRTYFLRGISANKNTIKDIITIVGANNAAKS